MAKIDETSIFTALYTMTNEYEEIIHQTLVPSKWLLYLKFSVEKMRDVFVDYGYEMLVVFFTDNVTGDKSSLEDIFPSLTDGVQPITPEQIDSFKNIYYLALPGDVDPEHSRRKT
jgi:hypothetical protein